MDNDILSAIWFGCKDLSDPQRNLLQALAFHCHHKTYTCWPSVGRLSKMIRRTERHTRRLLRSLEHMDYISVKVQRGRNHTNIVTINRTRICPVYVSGKTGHLDSRSKPDSWVSSELQREKEKKEHLLRYLGLEEGSSIWLAAMNGHQA